MGIRAVFSLEFSSRIIRHEFSAEFSNADDMGFSYASEGIENVFFKC